MTKPIKKQSAESKNWIVYVFKGLGSVMNQVGTLGFIVIAIVVFIFFQSTPDLNKEIIRAWILFEGEDNKQCIIVILSLFILLIIQQYHYVKIINMKNERIDEISAEKNSLQEKLINKKLSSSKEQ